MKARFEGRCRACGGPIAPGEDIAWSTVDGASHLLCARKRAELLTAPSENQHYGRVPRGQRKITDCRSETGTDRFRRKMQEASS